MMPTRSPAPKRNQYQVGQLEQRLSQVLHPQEQYSQLPVASQVQVQVVPINKMKQLIILLLFTEVLFYMESTKQLTFPQRVEQLQTFLMYNLGGPKVVSFRQQVDFFKGTTFLWIYFLMFYFRNYSSMYLYLFLHGSYGICWVIKDIYFPDARVMQKGSIGSQILLAVLLISYWMIPLPLAAGYGVTSPSLQRTIFLIIMYLMGLVLMMGADYQKTMTLRHRKGLISDGFFKYTRNPNYLGEILIYSSFVFCSGHLLGFIAFYLLGGVLFTMNIYVKQECSFKKKAGWEQYSKRSYILLPKIFPTFLLNFAFYASIFIGAAYFLALQTPKTFIYPLNQLFEQ